MKAGSIAILFSTVLLTTGSLAMAQQSAPTPPPLPPAPAALSVPNPLAVTPGPQDLYRSPDGSDRYLLSSPYPPPPPVFFPETYGAVPYHIPYIQNYVPCVHHYAHNYIPCVRNYMPYVDLTHTQVRPYPSAGYQPLVLRGALVLETIPDVAQVYVDGFYVGLVEEFGLRGRPLDLPAASHHIELRHAGFQTLSFRVMIEPDGIVRYRGDMQPLPSAAALPRIVLQQASPRSLYVIPNCYAGDKPPAGALPRGCSRKNLQTRK